MSAARPIHAFATALFAAALTVTASAFAAEGETPRTVVYKTTPPAPEFQTQESADLKSVGCISCHTGSDSKTMHANPGVIIGCTDCHGGDSTVMRPVGSKPGPYPAVFKSGKHGKGKQPVRHTDRDYWAAMQAAHVQPTLPLSWGHPSSANPPHSYTILNKESPEYTRFINPSDYRIAREACGACHLKEIVNAERSIMATGAMLWGGGAYNNGILPFKNYILGEAYTREGIGATLISPIKPTKEMMRTRGTLPSLSALPAFETIPPGDIFRVFERGGRNILHLFPEIANPNNLGQLQRLEEPGRPDLRQSNRGPGTGLRIAVPVLNIHKTRLNDPFMWFLGSNDNPGDFRTSGCGACHVVYANDREPRHSGPYARFGHMGQTQSVDPTIPRGEPGHPLKHEFTRAIPTAQCMNCHMHQPNIFLNSFLGYTMWDYESDAPQMWPKEQKYPTHDEIWEVNRRNPEEAAIRGKWSDIEFVKKVWELNPQMENTQFADYHGHGWNFRAIFKKSRDGTLLDDEGKPVSHDDKDKFKKAVHMSSIHLDKGMHCVDCHFENDSHGNGYIYGEVANAVEVRCKDCHGTVDSYPTLRTSGPAAQPNGFDLSLLRNQDGRARFEWRGSDCEAPLNERQDCALYQRPALWGTDQPEPKNKKIREALGPNREWKMSLIRDSVNPGHNEYNAKSARAKLLTNDGSMRWGWGVARDEENRAHADDDMMCFTCHLSWTTSCAGCHLPIQANWKTELGHYEGNVSRNYATYNPQVARDQMFQLGKHGSVKDHLTAPIRSTSALVLSSTNINRERIYIQQAPIAASGYSSQAFAPHFPHTVRLTETKTCTDCHLSEANDNNAIMAQLLLHGTDFVDFLGFNAWVGGESSFEAVRVTEWEEPQAVIGSFLQKYAYPDWYREHLERDRKLYEAYDQPSGPVGCLQLRGEYIMVAEGPRGTQTYDVASIANKGFSDRIITAPFSSAGHDTYIPSKNATCVMLPTTQPIHPDRQRANAELHYGDNQEQPFHPIYDYAFITDSEEGLIVVDVNTLADGKARNNFFSRALTWNEGGVLKGARHVTIAGYYFYVAADLGVVVLNMNDPMKPKVVRVLPYEDARATAVQFRYLFVTDKDGMKVVDVTDPENPNPLENVLVPMADAQKLHLARTYAYVAAGKEGLVIIDIENPEKPRLFQRFDAGGKINDARDVTLASTNATLFAYIADGVNGLKVVHLTAPDKQPKFYGFSPEPKPELIAWWPTTSPATALSRPLERDRAVDETGGQIAVLGRLGSRPFTLEEQRQLYMRDGKPWTVTDEVEMERFVPGAPGGSGKGRSAEGEDEAKDGPEKRAEAPNGAPQAN